jgi:hypothetical protein
MPTAFKPLSLFIVLLWLALPPIMAQQAEEVPFETVIKYSSNGPRKEIQTIVTNKSDWKENMEESPSQLSIVTAAT